MVVLCAVMMFEHNIPREIKNVLTAQCKAEGCLRESTPLPKKSSIKKKERFYQHILGKTKRKLNKTGNLDRKFN